MGKILISIFSLSLILGLCIFSVLLLVEKKYLKKIVIEEISKKTDKNISFDEDIKLSFFPNPSISIPKFKILDEENFLEIKTKKLVVFFNWSSVFSSKPRIKLIEVYEPVAKIEIEKQKNNVGIEPHNIFLNVSFKLINSREKKISDLKEKIISHLSIYNMISVLNGSLQYNVNESEHNFTNINLDFKNSDLIEMQGEFFYKNFLSNFIFKTQTNKLDEFNIDLEHFFKQSNNKTKISGKAILLNDNISFKGNLKSKVINYDEIDFINNKITNISFRKPKIYQAAIKDFFISGFQYDIEIKSLVDIVNFSDYQLKNTSFVINANNNFVNIVKLKTNYLNSLVEANLNYSHKSKELNGLATINDFVIPEFFFGETKFDLLGGKTNGVISLESRGEINDFSRLLQNSFVNTKLKINEPVLKGIDINKITENIDNIGNVSDFLKLLNYKNFSGLTKLNIIDVNFNLESGLLNIEKIITQNKNLFVETTGKYFLKNENFEISNKINLKTKKLNQLPDFYINLNGNSEKYKVSYDLDNIKRELFNDTIKNILKKNKGKLKLDKNFLDLLNGSDDNNSNAQKLIDLFVR